MNDTAEKRDVDRMPVYCDRLTLKVCVELVRMRAGGLSRSRARSVQILDLFPSKIWNSALKAMLNLMGIKVEQARFFSGHLKSATGEAASVAAIHWAQNASFKAAEEIVDSSDFLSNLNAAWGRNTIRLHIAKSLCYTMSEAGMRVFVASALAREAGADRAVVLLVRPTDFPSSYLTGLCSNLEVRFHSPGLRLFRTGRLYLIFWLIRSHFTELKWRTATQIQRLLGHGTSSSIEDNGPKSVLLMQESEVSLDRSYRTQPHWLFEDGERPQFRTYILKNFSVSMDPVDDFGLKNHGIHVVSKKDIALTRRRRLTLPVQMRLSQALRNCVVKSLLGRSGPQTTATVRLSLLFFVAIRMTDFCRQANIKAFMTCNNYHAEVDAVQLIAKELGIHVLSYQFANSGNTVPVLIANSDTMLMVSDHYHRHYTHNGIGPKFFVNIGYPYESSFQFVRDRAKKCRAKMEKAGAKFIICYFDENSTNERYGNIAPKDNIRDLLALMQLVLDDPSVGLVLKSKLITTSPRFLPALSAVRESVEATGRYVELMHGDRRNIVFPVEAALCADLVIGHAIGSTAVLESALADTRGILLNPYGITGENDALYAQADIVYPSMVKALEAIRGFRAGEPEKQTLGDWSSIIDQFDPIRDGQAGHRMRATLEKAIMGSGPSE